MITQTITASMTQTILAKIITRRYDVGREIKFILYKDELLSDPIDLTDYTVVITVIKPDNNFVIQNFVGDTVTITEQMEAVTGTGYYCVHVTKDTETIYTGQGEFVIDDVLISDDELDSISEVNGLKFPDDFITVEDHVAVIDDTVTTTEKTWSSSKISDEIENVSVVVSKTAEGNPVEISDGASAPLVECTTQITGSQDLHGYDKPWVGGAGKNKLPLTITDDTKSGVTISKTDDGKVMLNGTATALIDFRFVGFALAAGTYILSQGSATGVTLFVYSGGIYYQNTTFTIDESSTGCGAFIRVPNGTVCNNLIIEPMIRPSGTTADFTPYSNICPITAYTEGEIEVTDGYGNTTTHTTTYPSAIYRGSEDCVNGEVTSEWVKVIFDGSDDEGWTIALSDTTAFFFCSRADVPTLNWSDILCDSFKTVKTASERGIEGTIWIVYQQIHIHVTSAIAPSGVTSEGLAEFKAWLSNNPIEVAYPVKTPTTFSVTPTNLPIKSLSGYTHIESSTGTMEIEYITRDYQPLVESIVMESERKITKLWDAGFTPSPGVWLEYDFGEDLENYDAIVIEFVVSGWGSNDSDTVTIYPKIQHLNTKHCYHYVKGTDYGIQFWRVSGTTYGLGSIDGNYPPQYKAVYGIKY